jgi:hypothetical protein
MSHTHIYLWLDMEYVPQRYLAILRSQASFACFAGGREETVMVQLAVR